MPMGKQSKALDQQQYQPEPTSQQRWNPKKDPPQQYPSNENNQDQGNWGNQPQTQEWNPKKDPPQQYPSNENNQDQGSGGKQSQTQGWNNQNTQGNLNNKNSQWFSGNQNAQGNWNNQNTQGNWNNQNTQGNWNNQNTQGNWNNQNAQGNWNNQNEQPPMNQNQWGNQGNTDYYQQPIQQQWNTGQLPRIPKLSDPANFYPVPNSQLNIVIIINWIQFWILIALNLFLLIVFFPVLIITAPLTYLQYWTTKMLRRYSGQAKTIALVLAVLSALSVFSGNLFGLIAVYEIYVLGYHEETKMQFNNALL